MTDKELRKLRRSELLEMLLEQKKLAQAAEKRALNAEITQLREEAGKQKSRADYMQERVDRMSQQKEGITVRIPDVREFYADEQRDLILSILKEAKRSYCTPGSRAEELLEGILGENEITGEGLKLFERLKAILFRNKNITESDISDLRAIGFEVTRRANNHYKLVFQGDERYAFTLASTASEVRGMKNSYSDIAKMVSVYK